MQKNNQRQLKFRYWDTASGNWEHKFCYFELEPRNSHVIGYTILPIDRSDRYIIQQFTGLKDKNGKEIYEGDILKYNIANYTTLIIWSEEDSAFVTKSKEGGGFINFTRMSVYEIIGNICETPELLKN